jgi:hypothetical protein
MDTQRRPAFVDPSPPLVGWQAGLDAARSAPEVVDVARCFVARISAEEFAGLPVDCRPRKLVDADDLVDYAVTLVRRSCVSEKPSELLLQVAGFFTDACHRLSQLGRRPSAAATQ